MAKQLNVNLAFSADTSKAKAQINDLMSTLQNIAKMPGQATQLFDDKQIKEASNAALELQQHLTKATNVDTGKLDLSKFATSLKSSGNDLQTYYNQLIAIGPAGQQAFLQIAQAIATADASVIQINKKLAEMGTTLKNTARWQISSSILHGFMGTLQSAYGYAQDLNKSLNDIRIVTGASVDEMDKFAIKANRAAKALSTTTTAYTDAALIYYQQGLSDEEVEKRTNVTIKMAQAAGEDATEVSSYMTAIWNNFDNGSKSLEYYGDVMAKLGAKTAASSAEIAEGLEKFAAIGDTVGLSYEYATAAVATVVDKTRQSADTVGTAFKTIFARLQGLQLGETLEDGVDLNKYSAALEKVGVEVLDLNGNLRNADEIIYDLGMTWDNLSRAQQTALAQTVAGTRQYTQLVALMENFDAFQGNVNAAKNAEGTLSEQQDIYAESWEAASKRVKAAAQDIYDSILNDEFFIDLLNGFEKVLDGLGGLIDGFGGLKGIIASVGSIFLTMYAKQVPEALKNLKDNFLVFTGQSDKLMKEVQDKTLAQFANMKSSAVLDDSFKLQVEGLEKVTMMQQRLVMSSKNLSAEEIETYKMRIKNVQAIYDEVTALNDRRKAAEEAAKASGTKAAGTASKGVDKLYKDYMRSEERVGRLSQKYDEETDEDKSDALAHQLTQADEAAAELDARITRVVESIKGLGEIDALEELKDLNLNLNGEEELRREQVDDLNDALSKTVNHYQELTKKSTGMKTIADQIQRQGIAWKENVKEVAKSEKESERLKKTIKDYIKSLQTVAKEQHFDEQAEDLKKVEKQLDECEGSVEDLVDLFNQLNIGESFTKGANAIDKDIDIIENRLTELGDEGVINTEGLDDMTEKTKKLAQSEIELGIAKENAARQSNEEIAHQVKASEAMTEFGGAVLGAYAAVTTITNSISVLGDEEASAFEKIGAAMSLLMGIMEGYKAVQTGINAAKQLGNLLQKTEIGQTLIQTAVNWGLNASLAPVLVVIIAITAAVAALIAIVWLVVAAFKAWQASTPEAKLEAAKEEASRLSEELDKAREASDALKESIEGYDNAVAKMKTLTEGTAEWREALEEANAAARKMIDENEELKGQYNYNADTGLIEFKEGALESTQQGKIDKQNFVQSQKLMADNAVMKAERAVNVQNLVKENNISGGKLFAAGPTGWMMAGAQHDSDQAQTMALNILAEKFVANGGNMAEAMKSLDVITLGLVTSTGIAKTELEAFCQEVKNNTDAMHQNNKQIIDTRLTGNEAYEKSNNQDFLSDVMASDMSKQADFLYELKYKDKGKMGLGTGMSDSEAQKKYAELMGWDANLIKDDWGNKAIYINEEGEEVTISDEQIRKYLAQEEALNNITSNTDEYAQKVSQLAQFEKQLAAANDGSIESYEKYQEELKKYGKELGFTNKEVEKYINSQGGLQDSAKKANLSKNFQDWGYDSDASNKAAEELTKNLNSQQIQLAVEISATTSSWDEFNREFSSKLRENLLTTTQSAAAEAKTILDMSAESGTFSKADTDILLSNEKFTEYLEEQGKTELEFTHANYSEKMAIVSQYYSDLRMLENQQLEETKQNYQTDLGEYQAILDYKRALKENDKATADEIANEFSGIDFTAYADMDITDIEDKMNQIQTRIDEIDGQQIELNMSWDGVNTIENSMKKIGNFAKTMEKDAKKIGGSYQLTAAQAREWMEVYPDLFKKATVTTDGLISLDDKYVKEFMDGQEEATDKAIQADIDQMESEIEKLTAEKAAYDIDLKLAETMAKGKMDLEGASAEYLAETRENLTQYYIDNGLDQVAADKAALDSMGLNQKEYSRLVAEASTRNAENLVKTSEQGATGVVSVFSNLWSRLKNFWSNMGKAAVNVWKVFRGEATWDDVYDNVIDAYGLGPEEAIEAATAYDEDGNFKEGFEYKRTATLKEVGAKQVEDIKAAMALIDTEIGTLQSKVTYLRALQTQDLDEYGSTDAGEIDGTDKTINDLTKIAERYHEITRLITQQEKVLDRLGKAKDRAYGQEKIALMDQEIKELTKLAEHESELMTLQTAFLGLDKKKVKDTFVNADFDEYGNISNYTQLMQEATNKLNAAEAQYNKTNSDTDKKLLDDAKKKYEKDLKVLEQYEETLDAWKEQEDKLTDIQNQIQDSHFDKITYKVELQLEVNDKELSEIDYYLNKISEDFYMMEEALTITTNRLDNYNNKIVAAEEMYNQINESYENSRISQSEFVEGLNTSYETILDNLSALSELDKEMLHYYEDTLSMANEETDYYVSQMEHLSSVLDHYRSIVELVNGEYDYEAIGTILEGQAKTRENEMAIATAEYEMLLSEKKAIEEQMASVEVGSSAWDLYNEELQAITQATMEAEEEMLSKTEAWAESMKVIMENTFATAAYEMEMMMTQGLGFEALNNSLDKLSTFQEEYLTNTNEIFELEKMMRTAQQAADKTNNEAAKIKLKNYQNEIDTLKNDGLPLSQLELNIQKAKYDLLLAEIALEEAQNAKSTVRLQRDSEGNFGYVYTTDTEAISSAEQDLADAQNNLYNIGLEGTNDYGQKLLELQNQLSDDLIALEEERAAGRFKTDEEYYAAKNDLIIQYNNLFTAYSNQYTTALGVDNRIQEDAWVNAYQNMIVKTENWKDYTKEYTQECEDAYDEWRENAVDNNELIQEVLDDTEDEVKDVTKASDKLKKKVVDEVIPAIKNELTAVRNVTKAYANQRTEIRKTIGRYEDLIKKIREAIAAQAALSGKSSVGYDEEGKVTDYSWAMADYLVNRGGAYGDAQWNKFVAERSEKMKQDEYAQYADGADEFEKLMEKYYNCKSQGIENELTEYVEEVLANKQYWDQSQVESLIDKYQSFATGGYTGAWGPEGRLAVVHEKELMLNADDTVNFLQGIGLLREIAQIIDLEAMRNQMGSLPFLPMANMQGAGEILEQSVHIEANFPGVSDRYEIEEAFNNILNTATQYANRKI